MKETVTYLNFDGTCGDAMKFYERCFGGELRLLPFSQMPGDVPPEAKSEAARDINRALEAGWQGFDIAARFPLDDIAKAHEFVEHPTKSGRAVVII